MPTPVEKPAPPAPKAKTPAPVAALEAPAAAPRASAGGAPATRRFDNPLVDGIALDVCRSWAHECGQPAADAFCQSQGFAFASDYARETHAPPTRVISTGQVCNGSNCSRIASVTCANAAGGSAAASAPAARSASVAAPVASPAPSAGSAAGATRRFDNPLVNGIALDFCRTWAHECGRPAADAFCQSQGYAMATEFSREAHVPPTRVISSGQVCDRPNCARFSSVTCGNVGAGAAPPPRSATLEYGTNRIGLDMRSVVLPGGTPEMCRDACLADTSCRAFSFVQPGIQGPNARCWLKHDVPPPNASPCCVSGVVN